MTIIIFCFVKNRHYSPLWKEWDGGKIGGKPCWINPRDIPTQVLRCQICANRGKVRQCDDHENKCIENSEGTILRFLAQIYSPADVETNNEAAFHRSFYVYCCPHPLCSTTKDAHQSVVVLRGQLCRENEFYPFDCGQGNDWGSHNSSAWGINLCEICGQFSKGKCPLSKRCFCSKDHQKAYHKLLKLLGRNMEDDISLAPLIFAETELVIEEEPLEERSSNEDENMVASEMNKDSMFAETDDVDDDGQDDGDIEQSDLNEMTGIGAMDGTSDPLTMEFYTRIGRANGDVKGQCLRYCRWPEFSDIENDEVQNGPLWISSSNRPEKTEDIPCCQYCGSQRKFEFQLMPQIISVLLSNSNKANNHQNAVSSKTHRVEDGQDALLAASDYIDKAKEEGNESSLPEGFESKQKDLVERLKNRVLKSSNEDEDIDFGTISIYTCTGSCGDGEAKGDEDAFGAYRLEFAWRQPPL